MRRTHVATVRIAVGNEQAQLSKGQKAFNALIKQIDQRRTRLSAWEIAITPYLRKYNSDLLPLYADSENLQIELVHCLDRVIAQKGLTKTERRDIADLIVEMAGALIGERDDSQLKAIYNKHSRSDYDREEAAAFQGMASMLEGVLGLDMGDDLDVRSPEELLERASAKLHARQTQDDARRKAWEEHRFAQKRPSAKQLAKEARLEAEKHEISQSIREIYRKLVSTLHPDREADPQERQRKTALMQRVNQAYDKKNLLQLLELQLDLEHIDQTAINNISEKRLAHYNTILKEQLAELDREIFRTEAQFKAQFGIPPFTPVSPDRILRDLAVEIVGVQHTIRDLQKDLKLLGDVTKVKVWLKGLRRRSGTDDSDDIPF